MAAKVGMDVNKVLSDRIETLRKAKPQAPEKPSVKDHKPTADGMEVD